MKRRRPLKPPKLVTPSNRAISEQKETLLYQIWFYLGKEVDCTPLVFFRMVWGLVCAYEAYTFISGDFQKLEHYYMRSDFYPKYPGFQWIDVLPGFGLHYAMVALFLSSIACCLGLCTPISQTLYFIIRSYFYLLDASLYEDQIYLCLLLSFLMIFMPSNQMISLDLFIFPSLRSNVMPNWCLLALTSQHALVYIGYAFSHYTTDWLLGVPLGHWAASLTNSFQFDTLAAVSHIPLVSPVVEVLLGIVDGIPFMWPVFAYFTVIFSFTLGLLILYAPRYKETYSVAVLLCTSWNAVSCLLFFDTVSFLMLASVTILWNPDWIRLLFPALFVEHKSTSKNTNTCALINTKREQILLGCLLLYIVIQILLPLRFSLYTDDVNWTSLGSRNRWEFGMHHKACEIELSASDVKNEKTFRIDFESHLYGSQPEHIMPYPDLLIQFCHYIAAKYTVSAFGGIPPIIRANLLCELNYRGKQQLIDPNANLAEINPNCYHDIATILSSLSYS